MANVMICVLTKDQPQVSFAGDQHPGQAFAAMAIQWVPKTCHPT